MFNFDKNYYLESLMYQMGVAVRMLHLLQLQDGIQN